MEAYFSAPSARHLYDCLAAYALESVNLLLFYVPYVPGSDLPIRFNLENVFVYFWQNSRSILLILLETCLFYTVAKDICTFIILKADVSLLAAFINVFKSAIDSTIITSA